MVEGGSSERHHSKHFFFADAGLFSGGVCPFPVVAGLNSHRVVMVAPDFLWIAVGFLLGSPVVVGPAFVFTV